jgi:hypothetical protein
MKIIFSILFFHDILFRGFRRLILSMIIINLFLSYTSKNSGFLNIFLAILYAAMLSILKQKLFNKNLYFHEIMKFQEFV